MNRSRAAEDGSGAVTGEAVTWQLATGPGFDVRCVSLAVRDRHLVDFELAPVYSDTLAASVRIHDQVIPQQGRCTARRQRHGAKQQQLRGRLPRLLTALKLI